MGLQAEWDRRHIGKAISDLAAVIVHLRAVGTVPVEEHLHQAETLKLMLWKAHDHLRPRRAAGVEPPSPPPPRSGSEPVSIV